MKAVLIMLAAIVGIGLVGLCMVMSSKNGAISLEEKFKDLDFQYELENYYDEVCIGMTYNQMKDFETKKDFEKRIADRLKEMTGKDSIEIDCMVDGGRDG